MKDYSYHILRNKNLRRYLERIDLYSYGNLLEYLYCNVVSAARVRWILDPLDDHSGRSETLPYITLR